MLTHLRPALVLFVLLSIITGIVYPLAITGIALLAFADKANGSLIAATGHPHARRGADADDATSHAERGGTRSIGSSLIGQEFAPAISAAAAQHAKWFWGRPSATGPVPYTALDLATGTGSSGSNLAPSNPALLDNITARLAALSAADASVGITRPPTAVPVDLVTSSASGLDPHISPAAAEYQLPRVARARGMSEDAVRAIVRQHTLGRTFGVLGEPVVNVLALNLALDCASRPK